MSAAKPLDRALAFSGGALLALMLSCNSLLASRTTPAFASWVAHGVGAAGALLLGALFAPSVATVSGPPRWAYLGGIPGTFTVILAAVTVNSRLALSGTIALVLVGQVLFGLLCDALGWFGARRRRLEPRDLLIALVVLSGSALIIFGRAG